MAGNVTEEGSMVQWYRRRIGDPATDDEARGYWVFALGVLLAVVGILAFLPSTSASALREAAIILAAGGLMLMIAGPIIRLPLQPVATWLVYLGVLLCAAAIFWFSLVFPQEWLVATGSRPVIVLYALGMLAFGIGGVVVPILTERAELEETLAALEAELAALKTTLDDTEADEADLAEVIAELRSAIADSGADEEDLAHMVTMLRESLEDTEADEGDLAAQLGALRESQSRFELFADRSDEWRWRLRHRNGNVIATSGEGYTRRHNAQGGIQAVRRDALGATFTLIETEEELPPAEEPFDPVEERASQATFQLYEDQAGEHRWRLQHENGHILADSGEGYTERRSAETAIGGIREYVGPAQYLKADPTAFEVYRDQGEEWRWRLIHRNGAILADSGEGYTRRHDARRAVDRIKDRIDDAEIEIYDDAAGEQRWRLRAENGEIVADGGEGYSSRDAAEDAVERVRNYTPDANVLDIGLAAFEVFEDRSGEHRWRLRHRNGNILADSGEGYADRSGAHDAIESVKRNAPNATSESD